jgi:hypothetical protein
LCLFNRVRLNISVIRIVGRCRGDSTHAVDCVDYCRVQRIAAPLVFTQREFYDRELFANDDLKLIIAFGLSGNSRNLKIEAQTPNMQLPIKCDDVSLQG